jgi:hypothetical protein
VWGNSAPHSSRSRNETQGECHCDVILQFPSGKEIVIQSRPSNGDGDKYNGSLDIILPYNMNVVCWEGDKMTPSKASHPDLPEMRFAKQLVAEIP